MKDTRVIFMGTPEFAVLALKTIAEIFSVKAVVTQPDKPAGRGNILTPPIVKIAAETLGIPVLQPQKLRAQEFLQEIKYYEPDFIVTAAYGKILPPDLLALPKYAALNIHASLLPSYRGAAPIQRAVMNGEQKSGITIMHMDVGLDTGDIILQEEVEIGPDDTAGILHDKLAIVGARMIVPAMQQILMGVAPRIKQEETAATYAHPLTKADEEIVWGKDALEIHNLVRGLNPSPGAYSVILGERFKIWEGKPMAEDVPAVCGQVLAADNRGLLVKAQQGAYLITRLQPPGKKPMQAADYLRGKSIPIATILGK